MATLDEARKALADAVTTTGFSCSPYPPDTVATPAAYVDAVSVVYEGAVAAWGFCKPGSGTFQIITVDQRNDSPSALKSLESHITGIMAALQALPGVQVANITSGQTDLGGQTLPAVVYTVQAGI